MVVPSLMPLCTDQLRTSLRTGRHLPLLALTARDGGTQVRCRNVGMMALAYFCLFCLFLFYVLSFHRSATSRGVTTKETQAKYDFLETFSFDWLDIIVTNVSDAWGNIAASR